MRLVTLAAVLVTAPAVSAADLSKLPPNTWVEIPFTTEQPADPAEKGSFARQGWNKIVYDADGGRVLFYDRWVDAKHGGQTIYGNCLFALDPAAGTLAPVKIDNWTKVDVRGGGYRTKELPANEAEPTPCPRHVYHAFEYVSSLKSVFLCNGANQSAVDRAGKLAGHDLCDGAWRLHLKTNAWSRVGGGDVPPNRLDDAMAYCPDTGSIVYAGYNRQLWLLDLESGTWRKAKQSPPARAAFGQSVVYDPSKKRMLILGGGRLDGWQKGEAREFRELYAFDPREESVTRLADGPTAFYASHLAYDVKNEAFLAAAVFNKGEQPSGVFAYDPKRDAWRAVKTANPVPPHRGWFGWTQLCYDTRHGCFIGKLDAKFFAFRYAPAE